MCKIIGVRAGGAGGLQPPPPNIGQPRFFGQQEKNFGQSQFLKKFPFFFEDMDIC